MRKDRRGSWTCVGIGLVAGLLSGAFGVGGGVLIVPALVLMLHVPQRLAHGTSLAAVIPIGVGGVLGYLVHGALDVPVAMSLLSGSLLGAWLGALLLDRVPSQLLRWAFCAALLATAVRMVVEVPDRDAVVQLGTAVVLALVALGLVTGVLSGLLGVGGGIIMVPVLIVVFGMSDVVAKGTSLLVVVPTAVIATLANRRRGNVDLRAAAALGLAGVATSLLGSVVAVWLDPHTAAVLFALFLLAVGVRLAAGRRAPRPSPPAAAPRPGTQQTPHR